MAAKQIRQELYDGSRFAEAQAAAQEVLQQPGLFEDEAGELKALVAWCYYRQKKYEEAASWATDAGQVLWARECLMYLRAYAPGYKDDKRLKELAAELGDTVNVNNAVVIRARDADSQIGSEEVVQRVRSHTASDVSTANLWHNGARYLLSRGQDASAFETALEFIDGALARYGTGDQNIHHRAAANHWKSNILLKLDRRQEAITAAQEAVRLWTRQCELDPKNSAHVEKKAGAHEWLQKLLPAMTVAQ